MQSTELSPVKHIKNHGPFDTLGRLKPKSGTGHGRDLWLDKLFRWNDVLVNYFGPLFNSPDFLGCISLKKIDGEIDNWPYQANYCQFNFQVGQ